MIRDDVLNRIGHIAGSCPEVEAAYVFGSFLAREDYRDIDVALLFFPNMSSYQAFKLAMKLGSDLFFKIRPGCDFDVRVLNNAHPEFLYEVLRTGINVFSRNEQDRFDWEADVLSTYLDLKEMYDAYDREYLARA
jgi:predicted nucleotidyltransferase